MEAKYAVWKLLYSPTDDLEVMNRSEDRVTDDQERVGAVEHRESLLDALRQVLKHQPQHKLHWIIHIIPNSWPQNNLNSDLCFF